LTIVNWEREFVEKEAATDPHKTYEINSESVVHPHPILKRTLVITRVKSVIFAEDSPSDDETLQHNRSYNSDRGQGSLDSSLSGEYRSDLKDEKGKDATVKNNSADVADNDHSKCGIRVLSHCSEEVFADALDGTTEVDYNRYRSKNEKELTCKAKEKGGLAKFVGWRKEE